MSVESVSVALTTPLKVLAAPLKAAKAAIGSSRTLDSTTIEARVASAEGEVVLGRLSHDGSGQHTVAWHEQIALPGVIIDGLPARLPPGAANIYNYPQVSFAHLRKGLTILPPPAVLLVLDELLIACLLDTDDATSLACKRDTSGSTPLHGLLVANTPQALALALRVYQRRPALLLQAHTSSGPFLGENALHILAVNRREPELCTCIELAASHLSTAELDALFWQQASAGAKAHMQCLTTFAAPTVHLFSQ